MAVADVVIVFVLVLVVVVDVMVAVVGVKLKWDCVTFKVLEGGVAVLVA